MRTHHFALIVTTAVGLASLTLTGRADGVPAEWSDIKDQSYDTRVRFFAGLDRLESRVNAEVNELTARRGAMKGAADTKDWDFAMKEMLDARSYLKEMGDELNSSSPGHWDQEKEKVGEAWTRTQDAYDKVKSTMTD